ncbi:hypothetical protein N8J89_04165 [Crossiella sp. CA-258035]|uniref:hypothetical protein n=1 Tax=Crossiella sp. CA-258035 TaxID=2981138 RepID=UPI0024BC09E6|nr:hypothetical protein [Crossiella sp. CA-258035]WHT20274.1 hypothetical protein N8J89_04165 [Crossiella sp. CA-258035]
MRILLGVLALAALSACAPAPPSAPPATSANSAPTTSGQQQKPFQPGKHFVQIDKGTTRDGTTYLDIRPAKKEHLGESFETITLGGPHSEVPLARNSRIVSVKGKASTVPEFLTDLHRIPPKQRDEGFDVTVDDQGTITQVAWLYVPSW